MYPIMHGGHRANDHSGCHLLQRPSPHEETASAIGGNLSGYCHPPSVAQSSSLGAVCLVEPSTVYVGSTRLIPASSSAFRLGSWTGLGPEWAFPDGLS